MILRYAKYKLAQGVDTISSVDIEDNLPKIWKSLMGYCKASIGLFERMA